MNWEILGLAAGACTSASALPQLVKIIKTKHADDLSYFTLGTLLTGLALWTAYGVVKKDVPIIATNLFAVVVNGLVIGFTAKYKRR